MKKLLADLDAGKDVTDAAKALAEKLPELMPEDPAMAAVLAEAMAKEFGASRPDASAQSDALANEEEQPRGKTTPDSTPGSFAPAGSGAEISKVKDAQPDDVSKKSPAKASDEEIKAFLESPIEDIDVELANRLLEKGFEVEDGAGNKLHFGTRMKKHLEDHGQEESDRRKRRLRAGVELVKTTEPVISVRDANVSCYFGSVAGKNYLVMTDNSGEVYEVWDMFRRDKWKNEQKKGASSGQPADATGPHTPARKRPIAPTSSNRPNDGSSHDIKGGQT